jgi:hypothetical protein
MPFAFAFRVVNVDRNNRSAGFYGRDKGWMIGDPKI